MPWSLSVVIPAAGVGSRMGASVPKQYLLIGGKPVLGLTLERFAAMPFVVEVVVACSPEYAGTVHEAGRGLFGGHRPLVIVEGGEERQDSVRNALGCPLKGDLVGIHDAVRPMVTPGLVRGVCERAFEAGAAIPALQARETVKRSADGLRTLETVPRNEIWLAQTPQVFRKELIREVHRLAQADGVKATDDASLAEHYGHAVALVAGDPDNIKLTEPNDIDRVRHMLEPTHEADVRIGQGYDVHRLAPGRRLVLGGLEIPHAQGLSGHSDADALLHAITDAVIGALALGDIGSHFPDTDASFKDMDSRIFLRQAVELAGGLGYKVGNVDATVVAERPKLRPHIDAMRALIAQDLGVETGRVSVKATTSERMGFVGREEGIAAMATVLLVKGAH